MSAYTHLNFFNSLNAEEKEREDYYSIDTAIRQLGNGVASDEKGHANRINDLAKAIREVIAEHITSLKAEAVSEVHLERMLKGLANAWHDYRTRRDLVVTALLRLPHARRSLLRVFGRDLPNLVYEPACHNPHVECWSLTAGFMQDMISECKDN